MSDDFEESNQGRRWDDRRGWRPPDRPNVLTIFSQLGYNLWDQADINRLRENLEFAQKTREREETIRSRRLGWLVSGGIAILSALATIIGDWFVGKFR